MVLEFTVAAVLELFLVLCKWSKAIRCFVLLFTNWPVRILKWIVCINVVALLHANFTYNILAIKAHWYKLHAYQGCNSEPLRAQVTEETWKNMFAQPEECNCKRTFSDAIFMLTSCLTVFSFVGHWECLSVKQKYFQTLHCNCQYKSSKLITLHII